MKSRAAILHHQPGKWEIEEVDVDPPRQDELLIRIATSGLCHSDDHIATGDLPFAPGLVAGGHEGAGVIEEVGPYTQGWSVGDHVVLSFMPTCGRCRWCATGHQNLCDNGANILSGVRDDGSFRMQLDGVGVRQMSGISTFSQWTTVSVLSAVKIPNHVPLEVAALTGCAVGTGWGSAVNSAEVQPGDVVMVMGIGGIGMNAVQGAAHAGASAVIAVDPVDGKAIKALEFGATHAFVDIAEASDFARSLTNGQGADSCILCVGVTTGADIGNGISAIRKGGICVLTGLGRIADDTSIPTSAAMLTLYQKRIQGSLYGASNPTRDIPRMLQLHDEGRLKLRELITRRYTLDEINEGYEDMREGRNIRGVITLEG